MRRRFEGALGPASPSSSSSINDELVALRLAHTDLHARLESERAEASRAISDATRTSRSAEGERDQARLRCQQLSLELDRKDDQLRNALDATKALRAELQRWRAAHEAARRHTDQLEADLAHANTNLIPTLTRNAEQLSASLKSAETQSHDARRLADELRAELAQAKQALDAALAQQRDIQARADRDRAELNRRRADDQVKDALSRAERAQADAENRTLKEQVGDMKARCDALNDEIDELRRVQTDRIEFEEQHRLDRERNEALSRDLVQVQQDLRQTRQRCTDLERDYDQLQKAYDRLERDRSEAERRAADSEQRLKAVKESKATLKSDRSQLETQLHRLEVNMGSTSGRIQTLEESLLASQSAVQQLQKENETLRDANTALQGDIDRSRSQTLELGRLQTQAETDLKASRQKLTDLRDLMKDIITTLKPSRIGKLKRRSIIEASEILVVIEADIRRLQRELRADLGLNKRPTHRQLLANQLEEKVRLAQRLRAPNRIVASPSSPRSKPMSREEKILNIVKTLNDI